MKLIRVGEKFIIDAKSSSDRIHIFVNSHIPFMKVFNSVIDANHRLRYDWEQESEKKEELFLKLLNQNIITCDMVYTKVALDENDSSNMFFRI